MIAPTFGALTATPNVLLPPNGKYVNVETTVDDIVIVDDDSFRLRAARSGRGTGRVYTIIYEAEDSCGNTAIASVTVEVPLDRRGR